MKIFYLCSILFAGALIFCGCSAGGFYYYNDEPSGTLAGAGVEISKFKPVYTDRTPVILIHGLWGAVLQDKANENLPVWGELSCFSPAAEKRYRIMALTPAKKSSVAATDILRSTRADFLGMEFEIENYSRIINLLQAIGYVPEKTFLPEECHYSTLFIYHYDWRKSIDENAAGLAAFIEEKKQYLTNQFKTCDKHRNKEVRFDLLGHSMGGLIARYYVEYGLQKLGCGKNPLPKRNWYGAKNIRKLIMAGTPNAGYADTLLELVNGVCFDSRIPSIPAGVLATFPSYYQMLPDVSAENVRYKKSGKAVDIFDIKLWQKYKWGLFENNSFNRALLAEMYPALPEKERWAAAAEYADKLLNKASRFKLLFRNPAGLPPEPLKYYLFASAGLKTNSLIAVDDNDGSLEVAGVACGDGKVTFRSSGFERGKREKSLLFSDIYMLDGGHMGFMDSVLFAGNLALVLHSEL